MGQEIEDARFSPRDFREFSRRLQRETELLGHWLDDGVIRDEGELMGGFELEAWLVDAEAHPAPVIEPFLQRLNNPLVVPELARFNLEINSTPRQLQGGALSAMAEELETTWYQGDRVAGEFGARLAMVGILPNIRVEDFSLASMSPMKRYQALNDQVLRLREGRPIVLAIKGREQLQLEHSDVMLEAAATSFQIHIKVDPRRAVRFYNASKMLSAPMVALAANSPYLFGRDLWDETRIPLFEQAVAVHDTDLDKRVSFGIRYADKSMLEVFRANLDRFPVLLPTLMDEPEESLAHLRLHNGTIWRWTRPLVGFGADGSPHLRIEHRVVPAGPSVLDSVANAAVFFGAACALACQPEGLELRLPFERARTNFYAAARSGLQAEVSWLDGRRLEIRELISDILLPLARAGLERLGIDREEAEHWLGVVAARVGSGQNGAGWQRAYVERHGADMQGLTQAYLERQASGLPVHEWDLV